MTEQRMNTRRIFFLVVVSIAALCLAGCHLRGRQVNAEPPPPFHSPITNPEGHAGMTINQIKKVMLGRMTDDRSLLAQLQVTAGSQRSRTRQQFDVNAYFAPPDFLRARGSADAGSVFDFLLDQGQATILVMPEKKAYTGSQAALRANNSLLGGLQPEDMMKCFFVETNFYDLMEGYAGGQLNETADHYTVSFNFPTGASEVYSLRKSDLLIDRIDRYYNHHPTGYVRFDGYEFFDKHLLPIRFEAAQPSGAVATVEAVSLKPNAPRNKELTQIDIPPQFQRLNL